MRRFLREYLDCGASHYAGALAFSLFVALLPLSLGLLTVAGFSARRPQRFFGAERALVDLFPAGTQGTVRQAMLAAGEHPGSVGILSVLGLLWFSTSLFSVAGFTLNRVYGLRDRTFVEQRLRGLLLALVLALATTFAIAVAAASRRWMPGWLTPVSAWLVIAGLILYVYRAAPGRALPRADMVAGAMLAALLIVGLTYAFPLYAGLTGHLGTESSFFTVALGLVAWVYGIAQSILVGAVLNRTWMRSAARRRPLPVAGDVAPAPTAEPDR